MWTLSFWRRKHVFTTHLAALFTLSCNNYFWEELTYSPSQDVVIVMKKQYTGTKTTEEEILKTSSQLWLIVLKHLGRSQKVCFKFSHTNKPRKSFRARHNTGSSSQRRCSTQLTECEVAQQNYAWLISILLQIYAALVYLALGCYVLVCHIIS